MTWFKVDDGLHSHPKALQAGDAAIGLWVRLGSWSCQHLTEGAVPGPVAKAMGRPAQLRALLASGLLVAEGGDYRLHDFLVYNETREQVRERQAKTAARVAAFRQRRKSVSNTAGNAVTNAPVTGSPVPVPNPKDQVPPPGGSAPQAAAADQIVGAFIDGALANGMDRPGRTVLGRVGRAAKGLLADGSSPSDLITAARRLGANGWDDLEREVRRVQSERRPTGTALAVAGPARPSATDQRVTATLALGERLRAQETA